VIELISNTWIARLIQGLRPKGMTTLAWQRARRALRSQPGRFVRSISKGDMWRTL
jgi:hypothetical protein